MTWTAKLFVAGLFFSTNAQAVYSCNVNTSGLTFGQYRPFNITAQENNGNIAVSCSLLQIVGLLVSYEIRLSAGQTGSFSNRQLRSGASNLNYNLYRNAARTEVFGNGTAGTTYIADGYLLSIGVISRNYAVYGRIPAAQNVRAGTYTDTITITVTY